MQNSIICQPVSGRVALLTAFAKLKLLGSEQTYARSLVGLQAQIEALVMTNNLAKFGMLQTSN
ncbi:transposase, IS4 family [Ligilactobacillus ruminis]|nr:transposase, IS4 family [Ligilactobacillus ruminis]